MTGFFREMVKCIAVSILAALMALLVGGALWAAEGFPLPGKSAEAVAEAGRSPENTDGENEGKLSVEVPTVTVVQPTVQDNGVEENTPESDVPDTSIDSETESAKPVAAGTEGGCYSFVCRRSVPDGYLTGKIRPESAFLPQRPGIIGCDRGADLFI